MMFDGKTWAIVQESNNPEGNHIINISMTMQLGMYSNVLMYAELQATTTFPSFPGIIHFSTIWQSNPLPLTVTTAAQNPSFCLGIS